MSYRIRITTEAKQEILAAKQWYNHRQPGLGEDFAKTVKDQIDVLKSDTVDHKVVFDKVRRILVKRFPYVVYYTRNNENRTINILAVLHERQEKI